MPHRSPGAPHKGRAEYLSGRPIRYYRPRGSADIRHLVEEGFQAFNAARLGEACRIFTDKMLQPEHDTMIALTIAGAMTPAGLGGCVIELMERGLVDFVISTGANLYHDLHYALNFTLRRGSPFVNDVALYEEGVIRIYDVLFPSSVLLETDAYIRDFLVRSGMNGPVSTAELHYAIGRDLLARQPECQGYSVLAAAAAAGVPLYTSSPGDSSIGMNLAALQLEGSALAIDPLRDVNQSAAIVYQAKKAGGKSGVFILGGGSPKNFMLQTEPQIQEVLGLTESGHDYFLQITDARPDTGGLSGATPSEAMTWVKVDPETLPDTVTCYLDSTVALPLMTAYALAKRPPRKPRRLMERLPELMQKLEAAYAERRTTRGE